MQKSEKRYLIAEQRKRIADLEGERDALREAISKAETLASEATEELFSIGYGDNGDDVGQKVNSIRQILICTRYPTQTTEQENAE